MFHKQNGNALLYVLIAVTLLAVLTYTIAGENRGQQQNQLTESRTKLLASDLISHANSAELAFKQMEMFGIEADQVLFDLPGTAAYSTNVTRQIYHPSGGGLSLMETSSYFQGDPVLSGWYGRTNGQVEWTPSIKTDLLYSAIDISAEVCEKINQNLLGNSSIPTAPNLSLQVTFTNLGTISDTFTATQCPGCNNIKSQCFVRPAFGAFEEYYVFYNIIGTR